MAPPIDLPSALPLLGFYVGTGEAGPSWPKPAILCALRRFSWTAGLWILAPTLLANGAMGLGLEQWDLTYWAAYVAVIVSFETWWLHRTLRLSWIIALLGSVCANSLSAVCCGGMGFFAPFMHFPIVGTVADPNPFLSGVALMALWAVPSWLTEGVLWQFIARRAAPLAKGESNEKLSAEVWKQTFLVHLWGVPSD